MIVPSGPATTTEPEPDTARLFSANACTKASLPVSRAVRRLLAEAMVSARAMARRPSVSRDLWVDCATDTPATATSTIVMTTS